MSIDTKPTTTTRITTGCGNIYVTIGEGICYARKGRAGTCLYAMLEAIGRLARHLPPELVAEELKDIRCNQQHPDGKGGFVTSCADAVAKAFEKEGK